MPDITIPEILECAADYIANIGWIRDEIGTVNGPSCALGAISEASGFDGIAAHKAEDAFRSYLGTDIACWNDDEDRTAGDVILALTDCAAELRCKELPHAD